jgi:HEAT repeat protein
MGVEAYKALMKHNNAPVRAAVARYLATDPDPVTEDALVQTALADKDSIVREAALDALAQRGDPRCIEQLSRNLDEKIYAVRYRTAATIIRLSAKKAPAK